jgi:hypothetical protein
MTCTCEIRWIDAKGNPTPDKNPAIARVRTKDRYQQFHGSAIKFTQSEWFYICAEHAKRLSDPGMEIWEYEPLQETVQ